MAEQTELEVTLRARDEATKKVKGLNRAFAGIKRTLATVRRSAGGFFGFLKRNLLSLKTLAAGFLGGLIVKTTADFESGLAQVSTLVDTTKVDMRQFKEEIIALGKESGQSFSVLNKSLFDAISAGVDAAKAMDFLRTSTQLAIGGGTDVGSAVSGLVSILNSYGLSADNARAVSDSMFQAMKKGVLTIDQLTNAIGSVTSFGKAAGISIDELNAVLAVLTKKGLNIDVAATGLRNLAAKVLALSGDTAKLDEIQKMWGVRLDATTIKQEGLAAVMVKLAKATKGSGGELSKVFKEIRGLNAVLKLVDDGGEEFVKTMEEMANKAGSTEEAFDKVQKTLNVQLDRLKRNWEAAFIRIGDASREGIEKLIQMGSQVANWVERNSDLIGLHVNLVIDLFESLFRFLKDRWKRYSTDQDLLWKDLGLVIKSAWRGIVEGIKNNLRLIGAAVIFAFNTMRDGISRAFQGFSLMDLISEGDAFHKQRTVIDQFREMNKELGILTRTINTYQNALNSGENTRDALRGIRPDDLRSQEGALFRKANRIIAQIEIEAFQKSGGDRAKRNELINQRLRETIKEYESALEPVANKMGIMTSATFMSALDQHFPRFVDDVGESYSEYFDAMRKIISDLAKQTGAEGFGKELDAIITKYQEDLQKILTDSSDKAKPAAEEAGKKLAAEVKKGVGVGLGGDGEGDNKKTKVGFTEEMKALMMSMVKEIEILRKSGAAREIEIITQAHNEEVALMKEKIGENKAALSLYAIWLNEKQKELAKNTAEITQQFADGNRSLIDDIAQEAQTVLANGLTDAFMSIIDGTKSVKQAFTDMVKSILASLLQLALNRLFTQILGAAFGGAAGGAGSGGAAPTAGGGATGANFSGGFRAFASGEPRVTKPTIGLVGEGAFNEAIVPLPDGRRIPVDLRGAGGGGGGGVNLTIQVTAMDGADASRVLHQEAPTIANVFLRKLNQDPNFSRAVARRLRTANG